MVAYPFLLGCWCPSKTGCDVRQRWLAPLPVSLWLAPARMPVSEMERCKLHKKLNNTQQTRKLHLSTEEEIHNKEHDNISITSFHITIQNMRFSPTPLYKTRFSLGIMVPFSSCSGTINSHSIQNHNIPLNIFLEWKPVKSINMPDHQPSASSIGNKFVF